jgi:histidinol-phosphate aminotransferase
MDKYKNMINPRVLQVPEYDQKHVTVCWKQEARIQRLMSNESSYEPLDSVQRAINEAAAQVNWYPEDADYALELRGELAEYTGLRPENMTLGNGSMELLDLLFQTFIVNLGQDEVLMPAPDYSAYPIRAELFGWVSKPIVVGEKLDQAADRLLEKITPQTRMILFSRPQNPTGKVIPAEDVTRLLETGLLVVVDEAYVELAEEGTSLASLIKTWDNLIVLRTFSKGFGLAGLRLGYLLAIPEYVKYINMSRHIFNVNLVAMRAGKAVLENIGEAMGVIKEMCQTREWMVQELSKMPGLRPVESQANFVLVDVSGSGMAASKYAAYLYTQGYFVRDFSKKFGLKKDRYFRITVGRRKHIEGLIQTLKDFNEQGVHSLKDKEV